jgi:hypothetical protein
MSLRLLKDHVEIEKITMAESMGSEIRNSFSERILKKMPTPNKMNPIDHP